MNEATGVTSRTPATTPPCARCRHYGASIRDVLDSKSWKVLTETHWLQPEQCAHPAAMIARGSGEHDTAESMRQGRCGAYGALFAPLDDAERLTPRRAVFRKIGETLLLGHSRRVTIDIDGEPEPLELTMAERQINRLGGAPGRAARVRARRTHQGRLELEDWETD